MADANINVSVDPATQTRRWAIVSAVVAPVALIGGWTVAASRQPGEYSAVRQTISALAAYGAHDRLIMTSGLFVLGVCHLVTAAGLRPAHRRGRLALGLGGAATVAVAAFPQPQDGSATAHVTAATIAFVALSIWPALAARRDLPAGFVLALPTSIIASAVLLGLLVWFAAALSGSSVGLAERFLAGAQALWPLAVVLSTLRRNGRTSPWLARRSRTRQSRSRSR